VASSQVARMNALRFSTLISARPCATSTGGT
jgi:hypothetical protein